MLTVFFFFVFKEFTNQNEEINMYHNRIPSMSSEWPVMPYEETMTSYNRARTSSWNSVEVTSVGKLTNRSKPFVELTARRTEVRYYSYDVQGVHSNPLPPPSLIRN